MSSRRFSLCRFIVALLASALPGLQTEAAPRRVDLRGTGPWQETRAQGGGATYDLPVPTRNSGAQLAFLAGSTFRFRLGCNSFDAAQSRWQFRVEMTAPGTGITGAQEQALEEGIAHALGAPGTVTLLDEMDKETRRLPIRPGLRVLETEPLGPAEMKAFLDASMIRVETERVFLLSGTAFMPLILQQLKSPACAGR